MTRANEEKTLWRLFVDAFDSRPAGDSPHVVADEDLLARWSMGRLDRVEHDAIIAHLAGCPDCREVVGLMIQNGALTLPEVEGPVPEAVGVASHPPAPSRRFPAWVLVLAATVLVAVCLPLFWPSGEVRLDAPLALTEFGFELDGYSYGMPVRIMPEDSLALWESRMAAQPQDVRLRLEYGRSLLEHDNADGAIAQFDKALDRQRDNTDALVGKGVGLYQKAYNEGNQESETAIQLYRQALQCFRLAVQREPGDFSAHLNAAIVLDRLGEPALSREHWDRACELAPDDATKSKIDRHRKALP